ncbi:MAG: Hpt domain-containing protein [Spirochaetia bacterium]|jgi:HPt (histidine-containing phosphotransfer) domain-containing protein|nr:Hpt domain-containing protein [Spirochaetia bacterium]
MDKILNFETLLPRLENDESLVKEILLLYIDTTPGQIDTLKTALEEKDSKTIQYEAHSIKGSAGNISAEKVEKAASLLEITGKEDNIKGSESLFSILLGEYGELEILIKQKLNIIDIISRVKVQ